jgi:hypothetical protein
MCIIYPNGRYQRNNTDYLPPYRPFAPPAELAAPSVLQATLPNGISSHRGNECNGLRSRGRFHRGHPQSPPFKTFPDIMDEEKSAAERSSNVSTDESQQDRLRLERAKKNLHDSISELQEQLDIASRLPSSNVPSPVYEGLQRS